MPDIAPALLDTAAALEHDRLCAAAGKDQCAEEPCRTCADHDGAKRGRFRAPGQTVAFGFIARDAFAAAAAQHGSFIRYTHGGGAHERHALARVDRAAQQTQLADLVRTDTQRPRGSAAQGGVIRADGQFERVDAQQVLPPP